MKFLAGMKLRGQFPIEETLQVLDELGLQVAHLVQKTIFYRFDLRFIFVAQPIYHFVEAHGLISVLQ